MQRTGAIIVAEENLEHGDHSLEIMIPNLQLPRGRVVTYSDREIQKQFCYCVTAGKQLVRCDAESADTCGAAQGVGDE